MADWMDEWKKDKQKRTAQEDPKSKTFSFKQASQAQRIQYTNPYFTGDSGVKGTRSYQWEKDMLGPLRGYGRSYDDRFKNLTKQMGLNDQQAQEFRTFLDSREVPDRRYAMNSKGEIKDKRKTIYGTPGIQTVQERANDIIKSTKDPNSVNNQFSSFIDKAWQAQKELAQKKAKQTGQPIQKPQNGLDKVMNVINSPLKAADKNVIQPLENLFNRVATNATDAITLGQLKKNIDKMPQDATPDFVRQASQEPTTKAQKAADIIGQLAGATAPIGGAYKLISPLANAAKLGKYGNAALRGGLAGAAYSTAQQGLDEALNPNDANLKQRALDVAINTAAGAALDPAVMKLGSLPAVQRVIKKIGQGKSPKQVAQEENIPEDQINRIMKDMEGRTFQRESSGQIIDPNAPRLNAPNDGQSAPLGLNGPQGLPEPLINRAVQGLGKDVQVQGTPQLEAPKTGRPIRSQEELNQLEADMKNTWDQRQQMEDAHVNDALAPFRESQAQQAAAEQTWNTTVKQAKQTAQRIKEYHGGIVPDGNSKDLINEIPKQFKAKKGSRGNDIYSFAQQEGFNSADEAIQFLKQLDADTKIKLKDLAPNDGMKIHEDQWKKLEDAARKSFADSKDGQAIDSLLNDLMGMHKAHMDSVQKGEPLQFKKEKQFNVTETPVSYTRKMSPEELKQQKFDGSFSTKQVGDKTKITSQPSETKGFKTQAPLKGFKTPGKQVKRATEEINNSKHVNMDTRPKVDKVVDSLKGKDPVKEAKDSPFLMRLNAQKFNEHDNTPLMQTDKPMETKTAIEAIKNPVKRSIAKFYEGYVSRTHSAKVAETHIIENEMKKAQAAGNHALAKEYKAKLKEVKKSGSDFEKAIQNESASGNMAKSFLERHFSRLEKTVGKKDLGNALEYQMAKNLQWYHDNVDAEYKLPKGWDWGRVNDIVNTAELGKNADKYKTFTKQFRDLTQEWRDTMLEYNLINKEAHTALSKNPYYIPLARDISGKLDNIDRGLKGGSTSNKRSASAYFVREMGGGSVDSFFKNPLDTVIENTFGLYKNALKADTEQQAYRLAQMDKDGLFAKNITKKQYEEGGGIAVPTPQGKKYIRLQEDLLKVIQENELPMDINVLGKLTQSFAGLKTRSLEYQVTGAPRDIAQAYLNSQIKNPITYAIELAKSVKNRNAGAKEMGAYFEKAYKDHVGGLDPKKVTMDYAKKYKNVKVFDPKDKESWKGLVSTLGKALDMPFKPVKAIGNLSDELPRDVEVRVTKKLFMKKHGATIKSLKDELGGLNERIAAAEKATNDFDPALNGIEDVVARKNEIEGQLNQFNKDLKREQTYRGRDVMNFSRSGRSGLAKHIRQYVIFANTTTQSKDKIIRSFIERPVATTAKAALLMAPLVAAQQVIHQNMSKSDKTVYDKLPDYMKQFNYIFVNKGNVYTIPKLQELALISDPIEAALLGDKGYKRSAKQLALKELTPYQLGNVSQGLVKNQDGTRSVLKNSTLPGTVFTPGADMVANSKLGFNKKPISYGDKYAKEGEKPKAGKYTMDIFKKLGHNKPAADYAEYAVKQYGGDAGKYLAYLADLGLKPSDKKKIDAALQNLNPLQDRIYTNPDTNKGAKWFKDPFQETKKKK